jgi:uncharacterized membrane protein YphA (DoxX/SURF4 family)
MEAIYVQKRHWLSVIVRLVIGAVFVGAGIMKLKAPAGNGTLLHDISRGSAVAVDALSVFEIALGGWLITGWRARISAAVAIFVLAAFAAALVMDLRRPHPLPCGCFGGAARAHLGDVKRSLTIGIIRNTLAAFGASYLLLSHARPTIPGETERERQYLNRAPR